MVVGELTAVGDDTTVLEIYVPELRPTEARAGPNEGPAQRLRYVPDVHIAAAHPWNHGPEGKEVLPGDDHHPNVVPIPGEVAESVRGRVTTEPTPKTSTLLGNSPYGGFSHGAYLGRGSRTLRKAPTAATAPPTARLAFASLFKKPSRDPSPQRVLRARSSLYPTSVAVGLF